MINLVTNFIFRLTSICDKHCVLCCNNYTEIKKHKSVPAKNLYKKFAEVYGYWSSPTLNNLIKKHRIYLTGGEALLYKSESNTERISLFNVINFLYNLSPNIGIIIKTGGFRTDNLYQETIFDQISKNFPFPFVEWRLGWNLYQDSRENALNRFVYTVTKILGHQKFLSIDTIYDKLNLKQTCHTMELGLRLIGINIENDTLFRLVTKDPNKHRGFSIKIAEYIIDIDLGPSYAPNLASTNREYYSEPSTRCEIIENGTSCLYYDLDLKLIHCNDSFVDASVSPLSREHYSITENIEFLNKRFALLNHFIKKTKPIFSSRKERCFFCTKFIMSDVHHALI